ncbi:substrate-binding periplasmic protein [Shewanella polaris]|uniref:Transporter substrate-binding domain-containing protein n=1 Tax=Shewanella polaris TaxID=2588449 RepID=A0A4Y5YIB4_9GAMM|nr:transporter substrate-binding domain-containing protein [Shewanella polaris]QDE32229.1 transporter substrate-binding domain-containing protein [Shewanella polaris]
MNEAKVSLELVTKRGIKKMKPLLSKLYVIILSISFVLIPTRHLYANNASQVQFITHPLPPFSYLDNGRLSGFAIDILKAMMQNTQQTAKIEMYPFNRAFQMLKSQQNTALLVIAKRPEREVNMKWVGPIISSGVYFYQKSKSGLSLAHLEDLKRVQNIGVVLDNADHTYLDSQGFTNLSTDKAQLQSLKMLHYGRVDVAPMSELVMPFLAKAADIDINSIERTPIKLYDSTLYIAFSNDTSDDVVSLWQQAFDELISSGKYQTIYQGYFPTDIDIAKQ